jgi:hypothetical protein
MTLTQAFIERYTLMCQSFNKTIHNCCKIEEQLSYGSSAKLSESCSMS